jgi:GWxTD domain-containing protein
MGIETIGLPAGTYSSILHWIDKNDSTRADSVSVVFTVRHYPADKEYFSDIELCTSIQNSDNKQSMFYKNTLEVIPNPGRLYGSGLPILYYYATVYNLRASGLGGNVVVRTDVLNAAGIVIITKDKVKPRVYNSSVEIGTMNLSAVKTGTYEFRISLLDTINTLLATTSKRFFVYKIGSTPDSAVTVIGNEMSASKYAVLSMDEVDRLFSQARYIASATEKEQYQALTDLKVKQKFLYDFWRRRDANMATPFNEIEEQYYQRIERANTEFTSGFKKGWESDRGRVLVLYGNPDEVEHLENTSESNPYEIWHYHNLQGGVIFVFVDRDGMGNPQLVHSTHRDELRDDDWYNRNALKMK